MRLKSFCVVFIYLHIKQKFNYNLFRIKSFKDNSFFQEMDSLNYYNVNNHLTHRAFLSHCSWNFLGVDNFATGCLTLIHFQIMADLVTILHESCIL